MPLIVTRSPWTRQPQELVGVSPKSPLSARLTHLWTPSIGVDLITGERPRVASGTLATNPQILDRFGGARITSSQYIYLTDSAARINTGDEWTIFALMRFPPSLAGVSANQTGISDTAGVFSAAFDRTLGFTYSAPDLFAQGYIYDGATKTITSTAPIAYASQAQVGTVVLSCSGGFLRVFYRGIASTELAVSNNGYTGYSSAYFNVLSKDSMTGYEVGLVGMAYGRAWKTTEAQLFESDPWQLLAPRERRIWVPSAGGGGVTGASSGTVSIAGTATAQIQMAAASAATVGLSGVAAGAVAVAGQSAQVLPVSGSGAAQVGVAGASAGTIVLAGTASGVVGASPITGTSAATVQLAAAAAGQIAIAGQSARTVALAASGAAQIVVAGASAASVGLTAQSSGVVGSVPIAGASAGTLTLSGSASGGVRVAGSSAVDLPILSSGAAQILVRGASAASFVLAGSAAGVKGDMPDLVGTAGYVAAAAGRAFRAAAEGRTWNAKWGDR